MNTCINKLQRSFDRRSSNVSVNTLPVKLRRKSDLLPITRLNYNEYMKVLHCKGIKLSQLQSVAITFNNDKLKNFFVMKTNVLDWYNNLTNQERQNVHAYLNDECITI